MYRTQLDIMAELEERHLNPLDELTEDELIELLELREIQQEIDAHDYYSSFYSY